MSKTAAAGDWLTEILAIFDRDCRIRGHACLPAFTHWVNRRGSCELKSSPTEARLSTSLWCTGVKKSLRKFLREKFAAPVQTDGGSCAHAGLDLSCRPSSDRMHKRICIALAVFRN